MCDPDFQLMGNVVDEHKVRSPMQPLWFAPVSNFTSQELFGRPNTDVSTVMIPRVINCDI
jgi:hypothetical protein